MAAIKTLLIANRGEIAVRIIRAAGARIARRFRGHAIEPDQRRASDGGGDRGEGARVAGPLGGRHRVGSLAFLSVGGDGHHATLCGS